MNSTLPKVLHEIHGKPILEHVISQVKNAGLSDLCLVLSPEYGDFDFFLKKHPEMSVCVQNKQRGTGDAVAACFDFLKPKTKPSFTDGKLIQGPTTDASKVLICLGDTPALSAEILRSFHESCAKKEVDIAVLGFEPPDPRGYGRLVCDKNNQLIGIVEEKDADEETKRIKKCNSGVVYAKVDVLFELLNKIEANNSQQEYYLTDCVKLACQLDYRTHMEVAHPWQSFSGINTPEQLQKLADWMST